MNTLTLLSTLALAGHAAAIGVWTTPHDSYSSSIGVLGCKINTDRVAYWPGSVDCNNICIKLSYNGRSVHLLRIDQSGGAYDISYDAWNYLQTGQSAAVAPIAGGTVAMEYEEVPASECAGLIHTEGSKLPLSAANSMNFLASCLAQPNSWIAQNHVLFNICDAICSLGHDEECQLDLSVSNQPSCPHTLGLTTKLTSEPVYNIMYQTGAVVVAGTGEVATPSVKTPMGAGASGPGPHDTAPKAPEAPKVQPSPSAGIFKEQPPVVPATTPSPIEVAESAPTAAPPPAATNTWTTLVSSSVSSAAAAVPTLVSPPAPNYNATAPPAFQPPSGTGSSPTVVDVPTPSVTRVSPSNPASVQVSGASSESVRTSLLSLFAGVACAALLVV